MSRLKRLLHVADPSTRNTQQAPVQVFIAVAQHAHTTQQTSGLHGSEVFSFTPPGDPANDAEAVSERAAIMAVENGWDEDRALQEARWTLDRERCWRAFLRNAERILAAPGAKHGAMLAIYQAEAIRRYGESTGRDMALSLSSWVRARRVH